MRHEHDGHDSDGHRHHSPSQHGGERAMHSPGGAHEAHADQGVHRGPGAHPAHDAHAAHDASAGHDKRAGHSPGMFRDKFWLSLALTVPTLVWGHMLPRLFGYTPPMIPGSHWIAPVLGTAVSLYGGWPFLLGAVHQLRARLAGMMTLIALGRLVHDG